MLVDNAAKNHIWLCLTPTLIGPGSYRVELLKMPSAWRRFWLKFLLGWQITQTEHPYS
jgi:hypothetical protein